MRFRAEQRLKTELPEYYVVLCARRYAEMVGKLLAAVSDDERRWATIRLSYILESGSIEYQREYERRVRRYPDDFRKALIEKDGSIISRSISQDEFEIVRYSCAIPAFNLIDNLSALEMQGLADMYEGWAQSDSVNCINVARLHGWSDGFRSLVEVVGIDYVSPKAPAGAPVSLMKFMALQMDP